MELKKAIKERRSIRSWHEKKVDMSIIKKIIEYGTWAPSACNRQLWRFVIITDNKIKKQLQDAGAQGWITKAPVTIAVFYHKDINSKNHANIQSASAAIENILLLAHEHSLGSLWMADIGDFNQIKKIVKAPKNFTPVAYILLGYPKHIPTAPKRQNPKDIIGHNTFPGTDISSSTYPEKWTTENIIQFQEKTCRATTAGHKYFKYPKKVTELIEQEIIPKINGTNLDLFAYDGHTSSIIAKKRKIELHECSNEVINFTKAVMKKKNIPEKNYKFILGKAEKIPKKNNSTDNITIILKLERFPDKSKKKIIDECSRILKPKGKLIILYRNRTSLGWLNKEYRLKVQKRNKIDTHYLGMWSIGPYYATTEKKMNKLMTHFNIIEKKGFLTIPFIKTALDKTRIFCEYQLIIAEKKHN